MLPELIYRSIETLNHKPLEIWDRISYSAKLRYCEVLVQNNDYVDLPVNVFELYMTYIPFGERLGKKVMEDLINN